MKRFALAFIRFAKTVGVFAALVFAVYLPIALDKQATHSADAAKPVAQVVAKPQFIPEHGNRPWSIDFANQPDGRLSGKWWDYVVGNKTADYNNELQTYTSSPRNVRVQNGMLIIEALDQPKDGKQFTSARVDTHGKFDFTYGTIEVDMKLPTGIGSWPAAWLVPANDIYKPATYGITPSDPFAWALNGEVDFAEAVGYIPGQNIPAIHSYNEVQRAPTYTPAYIPDSATAFHRYGVIKSHNKITFTIDGKPYNTRYKTSSSPLEWPYDQPYYLVLDLAVGGTWAGDYGVDTSSMPWQLQIKSISFSPKY